MSANIDLLSPKKHLIDLADYISEDHPVPENFELSRIYGDIIMVAPIDENDMGELERDGVVLPKTAMRTAWRTGKVLLVGRQVDDIKPGEYVIYPNDRGLSVKNLRVKGIGKVAVSSFINEERIFGVCSPREDLLINVEQ
jgi:hypothetical protein